MKGIQMSNINLYQNCYKKDKKEACFDENKELSRTLLEQLRNYYKRNVVKHIAHDLNINVNTVRNWIYRNTGLRACDLLMLLDQYVCIQDFLGFKKVTTGQKITGKKDRKELCEKIINLLSDNPEMTIKELAQILKTTAKTIEWSLYLLIRNKRIKRIGATKGGKWLVRM